MKEVTIQKEHIEYIKKYEAFDGEVFNSQEECEKYESSAECLLRHRFKQYIVNDSMDEWQLFATGDSEHPLEIVEIPNDDAVKAIIHYYSYYHCYMSKEHLDKFADKVDKAYQEGDLLIFGYNYDKELYFIDSRNNIISRLNNISRIKSDENN